MRGARRQVGGDIPRGETAAESDGQADGAGDPPDLLGQGDSLDCNVTGTEAATPNLGISVDQEKEGDC